MNTDGRTVAIVVPEEGDEGWPVQDVVRGLVSCGWNVSALAAGRARNGHRPSRRRPRKSGLQVALRKLEPRLVHFLDVRCVPIGFGAARAAGCRVVLTVDGAELPSAASGVWDQVDALHVHESGLVPFVQRLGCPTGKPFAVIPPAVAASDFALDRAISRPTSRREGEMRVLSVGALRWEAGFEDALAAVKLLVQRGVDCRYRIVGDGVYAPALAFARDQLGLEAVTEVLTSSPETLTMHLDWADVYLGPGLIDAGAWPIVRAQARGLPVVATAGRGLRRDLVGEGAGFVVSRRDPRALAGKLELLADRSWRQRMGDAAQAIALERFSAQSHALQLDDLYRRTLNDKVP